MAAASQHFFLTVVDVASLQLAYVPRYFVLWGLLSLPDKCAAASMEAASPSKLRWIDSRSPSVSSPYHIQPGQSLGGTF